jgi:hypothetical protein
LTPLSNEPRFDWLYRKTRPEQPWSGPVPRRSGLRRAGALPGRLFSILKRPQTAVTFFLDPKCVNF